MERVSSTGVERDGEYVERVVEQRLGEMGCPEVIERSRREKPAVIFPRWVSRTLDLMKLIVLVFPPLIDPG
jgi:hypothetical protein